MGTFTMLFRMVIGLYHAIFSFLLIFSELGQKMTYYYWTKPALCQLYRYTFIASGPSWPIGQRAALMATGVVANFDLGGRFPRPRSQ